MRYEKWVWVMRNEIWELSFELRVNQTGPQFLCKSDSATLQQPHPEQSTARSEIPLPRSEIGDGEIGIRTSSNIKVFQFSLFFFISSLLWASNWERRSLSLFLYLIVCVVTIFLIMQCIELRLTDYFFLSFEISLFLCSDLDLGFPLVLFWLNWFFV